jgi:hypothetical protein
VEKIRNCCNYLFTRFYNFVPIKILKQLQDISYVCEIDIRQAFCMLLSALKIDVQRLPKVRIHVWMGQWPYQPEEKFWTLTVAFSGALNHSPVTLPQNRWILNGGTSCCAKKCPLPPSIAF